jgi:hypothetical protein
MESPVVQVALVGIVLASGAVSIFLWTRIAKGNDPLVMKLATAFVVALPVFGPLLWLFLDMPPKRPGVVPPFSGPLAPFPKEPKWAARWARMSAVLSGLAVIALMIYVAIVIVR